MKHLKKILLCILASIIVFKGQIVSAEEINLTGKVTGLVAKHKDHMISLEWDLNREVDRYVVERNGVVLTSNQTSRYYTDENVGEDITYTYTVYPFGSDEKTSVDIYVEKDTSTPKNIRLHDSKKIGNTFIELKWDEPFEYDYKGVYVYFPNGNKVDLQKGKDSIRINNLKEGTSYTYTFCAHDGSGNEVPFDECVKSTNTTTVDHSAPLEVNNLKVNYGFELIVYPSGNSKVINEGLYVNWNTLNIDDYYGAYVTLPDNKKVFVKGTEYLYRDYNNPNYYNFYPFYVQTVDHNGNVSKGSLIWWEHPEKPPGNIMNEKVTEKNGIVTVSFTPPSNLDYVKTTITLPGGKVVDVFNGKNSYSYKGKLLVGQINEFKLRAFDKDKNSSSLKQIILVPKTKAVNKYTTTKVLTSIRSLPDGKGKPVLSVKRNNKIKILSRDYGIKHNYLYVQFGTTKGYIPKTAVK